MKQKRTVAIRVLAMLSIASFGIAACSSSKKTTTTNTTATGGATTSSTAASSGSSGGLKIGFFGALTGPNAQLGINIRDGAKLAVSQYNTAHPSATVSLDEFDSQGESSQASTGATKLIGDKVVAVVGPAFSGESETADKIFEQAQIPYVSASATAVDLATAGRKFFHRVLADDSLQGPADANYIVKTLSKTQVAVIDDNSAYGKGLADNVRSTLTTNGGKDVVDDHLDPKGSDYGSTVNKITSSGANAVFFGGYYDAAGRLLKALSQAGFKGAFMSGDGSEDQRIVNDAGGSAAEGAYLSCACADETSNTAAAAFVSAYKAMFSDDPAIYSAEAYDAANFILAAIGAGKTAPTDINDYLTNNSYTGVTKTVKFQANGNVSGGTIYIYKVENGKVVQIGTTGS